MLCVALLSTERGVSNQNNSPSDTKLSDSVGTTKLILERLAVILVSHLILVCLYSKRIIFKTDKTEIGKTYLEKQNRLWFETSNGSTSQGNKSISHCNLETTDPSNK